MLEAAHRIAKEVGAKVDDREGQSPGAKFFHWERRGVPVVLELGPRDLATGKIVLKRRDTGAKEMVGQEEVNARMPAALDEMQTSLFSAAKERLKANTVLANSMGEVEGILSDASAEKGGGKFVMAHIKDDPAATPASRNSRPPSAISRWSMSSMARASASSPARRSTAAL